MDEETGTELGLEPCGLRRHDVAGVGNIDNLLHAHGIESEGNLHLAAVHATLQLAQSADTAHEVDALVRAQVLDAEHLVQDEVAEDGDVEHADGVIVVVGAGLGRQAVPHSLKVHREEVEIFRIVYLLAQIHNLQNLSEISD